MAVRRINIDLKELEEHRSELNRDGIFWNVDESNLFQWRAVIMGTSDTPYEYSYHFFRIFIPSNYPFEPPKFYYCTGDGLMRMNPNLYELPSNMEQFQSGGKTCLSLLNTWSGPGWTPVNSIKTVLITIQAAVLVSDPLKNEPGKENSPLADIKAYNDLVTYKSLELGLTNQLINTMEEFKVFLPEMNKKFIENYDKIMEKIDGLIPTMNGLKIKAGIWSNTYGILNYQGLKEDLISYRNCLSFNEKPANLEDKMQVVEEVQQSPEVKKTKTKGKKTPATSASNYDSGYITETMNDGVLVKYVVKVRKNGVHYWTKYKGV